jgi:hypothetical protein
MMVRRFAANGLQKSIAFVSAPAWGELPMLAKGQNTLVITLGLGTGRVNAIENLRVTLVTTAVPFWLYGASTYRFCAQERPGGDPKAIVTASPAAKGES